MHYVQIVSLAINIYVHLLRFLADHGENPIEICKLVLCAITTSTQPHYTNFPEDTIIIIVFPLYSQSHPVLRGSIRFSQPCDEYPAKKRCHSGQMWPYPFHKPY